MGKEDTKGAANLKFPSGERCGLTAVALSISSDKEAPSIVREIIQNSLDAATTAGRDAAHVKFSLENISPDSIPGITEYKKALKAVANRYEKQDWPEQSKDIIDRMQEGLKQKTIPALIVTDNGIGLNKKTMMAILSDGVPEHNQQQSTGSHGNGHFTTFNLSDMRYVLYGGISKEDGKITSGHAILASHQNNGVCGKDGYYVRKISDHLDKPHDFAEGSNIPELIRNQLEKIESEWETGTVLIVPDFNYFGEAEESPKEAANMILGAAAQNFFVAVQRGSLVVSVEAKSKKWELNSDNIQKVMVETSKIPRATGFPHYEVSKRFSMLFADCGKKAPNTDIVEIPTKQGKFEFCYRTNNVEETKIALCRNGMWITAHIPMLPVRQFFNNVPFEGLLLCDADKSGSLHDYIRRAEGNLHNSLTLKLIQDKKKKKLLSDALKEAREFIQKLIAEQNFESVDLLEINADSIRVSPPKRERVKRIDPPPQPKPKPTDNIPPPASDPNPGNRWV